MVLLFVRLSFNGDGCLERPPPQGRPAPNAKGAGTLGQQQCCCISLEKMEAAVGIVASAQNAGMISTPRGLPEPLREHPHGLPDEHGDCNLL